MVRTMDDRQLVRLVDTFGYDSDKISMVFLNITDDSPIKSEEQLKWRKMINTIDCQNE